MKLNLNKVGKIFMSRIKPKDTNKDWIKTRKEICRTCPFNTDNIADKSFTDNLKIRANQILNFILGRKVTEEATCVKCGCMLVFKSAEPDEYCPEGKWKRQE